MKITYKKFKVRKLSASEKKKLDKKKKYTRYYSSILEPSVYEKIDTRALVEQLLVNVNYALLKTKDNVHEEYKQSIESIVNTPNEILNNKYQDLIFEYATYPVIISKGTAYQKLSVHHYIGTLNIKCTIPIFKSIIATSYDEAIKVCKKLGVRITVRVIRLIKYVFFKHDKLICF